MVLEEKKGEIKDYEIFREGSDTVLKINYLPQSRTPSIEDDPVCMARTMDYLMQVPSATRIIFNQRRNYIYDYEQVKVLKEIVDIYKHLIRQKKLFFGAGEYGPYHDSWRAVLQNIIMNLLRTDPIGAYVDTKRILRQEKVRLEKAELTGDVNLRADYLGILNYIHNMLQNTTLIQLAKPYLAGYSVESDREIYKNIFRPMITPDFMFTRLMAEQPMDGEILDVYSLPDGGEVTIFKIPGETRCLYHLIPPEFKINEEQYEVLDVARRAMIEHKPTKDEFLNPDKMRETFLNIGKDLIRELAEHRGIMLSDEDNNVLAKILVRYTVGFGLIEVLLQDQKIQDIAINGPIGETPMFVVHGDFEECNTNIIPSKEEGESWASKFRMISGRPLDEANPILDTELILPGSKARVAIITGPLNPVGLAYAFRRHRDEPWTYPLFIKNKMMNPLAAGLLSFLIDGGRTLLFAGTRGSGKTSLLGSSLVEIMKRYRIISCEDTLELPVDALRKLGYNIQSMKVRSALMPSDAEVGAEEGIRASLRMGDSSLIVGEIRSKEAKALYEAMRVGALANVVAGTVHGADPYGVYDRIVNDLEVPKTSFKATDVIIITNQVKSADGLHKWRRVTQITEVRKTWEEDPLRERGFVDLMIYDSKTDSLKPTDALLNGDSEVLKAIAGGVKDWAGDWNAVWDNILLRADIKNALVEYSEKLNNQTILEAGFIVKANDAFHQTCESVREDLGYIDSKRTFFEWNEWMRRQIKKGV
ncbi:MAG: type II/IV secretion system ATPase subunit [Nanoarchaeota archaeon]|nr:type II/IV secretion system ATPase subunit [Nanoarchaeota archaeon]